MDPNANLESQLELAHEIMASRRNDAFALTADALAEHVVALHEWIAKGGFLPSDWDFGRNQGSALLHLIKERGTPRYAHVNDPNEWMMAGYVLVTFPDGFECGIAPDGAVSS